MDLSFRLNVFQTLYLLLHGVCCFLIVHLSLIVFSPALLLVLVYRKFVSLIFKFAYANKYELTPCSNAAYNGDEYGNVLTITFFVHVRGPCDVHKVRERISSNLKKLKPFGVLLKAPVQKFGFTCWEDKSDSIDFSHHIRLCPGAGNENRVYSENEVFEAVAKLADDLWEEGKPRWEFLVTPKVKMDGGKEDGDEVYGVITMKIHHMYLDGISFVQVVRNLLGDQPPPKFIFDPVNPPLPPVPLYKKILLYMQVFFLGPYYCMRLMGHRANYVFHEGPLKGHKLFGRTKMEIPLRIIRDIRKKYNTSTQAILHTAFITALENMATKKGFSIPDEVIGGVVNARFPYPNEYPHNLGMLTFEPIPMGLKDKTVRLRRMTQTINTMLWRQYALVSSLLMVQMIGLYPTYIAKMLMKTLDVTYFISNVPGLSGIVKLHGNTIENVFGVPPIAYGIRYSAGVGYYKEKFTVCFLFEESKVVSCHDEMEEFIQEFENEVKYFSPHVD